ncbi:MFS transporter [Deinococcus daejeonensis]|uniref:MFS transporter n=1 Tax=Deinococcus daejeonensis TaxID=1007098 RepID=UPI00166E1B79|nr:MFS transporter [Deinococcus daejeonensis]
MLKLLSRNKDFGFLLSGRLATNIGDSLYSIAALWLVHELGGSSLQTGLAYGLTTLPSVFSFLFGPLVDRVPKRSMIIGCQILQAILISIIPLANYFGFLTIWVVMTVIPLASLLGLLAYYAENAIVPELVGKDDLVKANSALSVTYQGTDLAFNALAGILIAIAGAVSVILFDVLTFIIAIILFSRIKFPVRAGKLEEPSNYLNEIRDGFKFAIKSVLLPIILGGAFINVAFGAALGVFPGFAALRGGSEVYGLLMTGLSGGVLIGSLLSNRLSKVPVGNALIFGYVLIGILWILFVYAPSPILTVILLAAACIPLGATNVMIVSLLQKLPPESMVGRLFAIAGSVNTVGMPLGAVLGGWLATVWGEKTILGITGATFLILAFAWWLTPRLRTLPIAESLAPVTAAD